MLKSPLALRATSGVGPDDRCRSDRLVAEAWRRDGLVLVAVDDPMLTWTERELLRTLAERKFGRRYPRRAA